MMNTIFLAFLLNLFSSDARVEFHQKNIEKDQLLSIIENKEFDKNNIDCAYKGLCETMMASHVFFFTTKLKYFNLGKERIDEVIKKESRNSELCYIRLLVQLNAPSFLGYNEEINQDFDFFVKGIQEYKIKPEWKLLFVNNLLKSKNIEEEQEQKLLLLIKELNE